MAINEVEARKLEHARKPGTGIGLLKGMLVTLKHLFKHNTVIEYPDVKQDLPPRTRGVIALKEENCTVCMLCARECPDWCIYIDSHKETLPPKREGGRPRKRNVLDRFAIDYALCMYCGICVEVCPYDALFWSREYEYSVYDIRELTHEKEKLSDWMATVLPPPPLESGAMLPGQPEPAMAAAAPAPAPAPAAAPAAVAVPAPAPAPVESAAPVEVAETPPPADVQAPAPTPAAEPLVTEPEAEAPAEPEAKAPVGVTSPDEGLQAPPPEPTPTGPPASNQEAQKIYDEVLQEQIDKGASQVVAEARAKVARVKAERGIGRAPTPVEVEKPVPSAPTKGQAPEPTPSGAPRAEEPKPEQGPVEPTVAEAELEIETPKAEADVEAPDAELTLDPTPSPEPKPAPDPMPAPEPKPAPEPQPAPAPQPAPTFDPNETPDQVYERVLKEEMAKGSSQPVAVARAKAARMRKEKGTEGP